MNQKNFDINKFSPFRTSSGLDENFTGIYENKIVRVIKKDKLQYKRLLEFSNDFSSIIHSKMFYEDENILVVEHDKLENMTYFTEWTTKQKVIAAKTVVQIQSELSTKGFYLNDPHAFNITFHYSQPIYFDFGSIKEGQIPTNWWFIKCFCGWTENDYWDQILRINRMQKIWIALRLSFTPSPYQYLLNKLSRYEVGFIEKQIIFLLNRKSFTGRFTRKIVNSFPLLFKNFSNWTDYEQKIPTLDFDDPRNKHILQIFKEHKPKKVLDIGANKGAFSLLALDNGTEEIIAVDLDNYSLDYLFDEIKSHKMKATIAKLDIMNYPQHPGYYQSYYPAHERLNSDFTICLAVVHHICYFGNNSFEEFAEKLDRFTKKMLIVEFVPYDDIHLTGSVYKGKNRNWYTIDNFISVMKKKFPSKHEIYQSSPSPRVLIKFCK